MKRITDALLRSWPLPAMDDELGKASRGTLLVVGGSDTVAGAATLAALGAIRVGAGTIQVATTRRAHAIVATAVPEACVVALPTAGGEIAATALPRIRRLGGKADAVVLGPGSRTAGLARAIAGDATWIVDAGALEACTPAIMRPASTVITPHAGEMAALVDADIDDVRAEPVRFATQVANQLGCVVALKGATTVIADPDGATFTSTAGNHGLGGSGSGDVLAGVIGGLAARGATAVQAAVWGVHLHGAAGDVLARRIGPYGYRMTEVLDELPRLPVMISAGRTTARR